MYVVVSSELIGCWSVMISVVVSITGLGMGRHWLPKELVKEVSW